MQGISAEVLHITIITITEESILTTITITLVLRLSITITITINIMLYQVIFTITITITPCLAAHPRYIRKTKKRHIVE